ncbi:MAG TPA: heavy metal-binding domain-containing protein [Chitinophagaceae bacterium]|nr:heavy metal-binding domain-containing protein [Chitinophagaceae bacterium]
MNKLLKISFVLAAAVSLAACNNDATNKSEKDSTHMASADGHQHSYRCPMNCEKGKTYDQPGKCPVCGMKLEHYDGGEDNGLMYKMQYASNPAELTAGEPATLSFTPKVVGKESESVALDLQHEKKIHLIVVSDDLSYFEHIHPDFQADGSYQIKVLAKGKSYTEGAGKNETRFENGGNYFLFADYKPTGGSHQVEKVPFIVKGVPKVVVRYTTEKLSGNSGNYSVTLNATGGKLITGTQMHIAGTVLKDGKEIDATTLEDYLGAKAHMVVISLDDKEYLHVHPDVANGKFDLHTTFKNPGIYRGWIQFQADGKVHTVDFTMNVVKGEAADIQKASEGHPSPGSDHSNH